MHMIGRRGGAALALLALTMPLLAGCGNSNSNSSNAAHIRVADVATTPAGTSPLNATLLINNAAAFNSQTYYNAVTDSIQISSYLYINGGTSSFSYIVSPGLQTGASALSTNYSLSNGVYYTAYLVGRPDTPVPPVTNPVTPPDPRFLQVIVTNDTPISPAPGAAIVRVLNAAPDANMTGPTSPGALDVTVGTVTFSGVPYTASVATPNPTTYQSVPVGTGTLTVTVKKAETATVVPTATTTMSIAAGQAYTLLVTEPVSTPTFDIAVASP